MRSRFLKATMLLAAAGAMWTHMPQVTVRLAIRRRLSLKCFVLGHEDWIRWTSDRLYLECFECGRETRGWTTGRHQQAAGAGDAVQAQPVNKRDEPPAPALVRSSLKDPRRSKRSIGDHCDMTIAA